MPRQSLWGLGNILRDQVEGIGDDSDKLSWERQSVWNGVGRLPCRRAPIRLEFSERATQLRAYVLQSLEQMMWLWAEKTKGGFGREAGPGFAEDVHSV